MREWLRKHEIEVLIGVVATALVVALAFTIHISRKDAKQWANFAEAFKCKVVERKAGTSTVVSGTAIGPNGTVTPAFGVASTPSQTAYLCDDGVVYWR